VPRCHDGAPPLKSSHQQTATQHHCFFGCLRKRLQLVPKRHCSNPRLRDKKTSVVVVVVDILSRLSSIRSSRESIQKKRDAEQHFHANQSRAAATAASCFTPSRKSQTVPSLLPRLPERSIFSCSGAIRNSNFYAVTTLLAAIFLASSSDLL